MSKILIIDDEEDLVTLLKDSLENRGHTVFTAYNGLGGIEKSEEQPEIIVLDIMMPDMDGYEVCRNIRDRVQCPIIFLSAKQSEMDKIKGFALGGDDYIIKPFSIKELMARIDAHLRREKRAIFLNEAGKRVLLNFKNLTIDLKAREVHINNIAVILTKKEFNIIQLLSLHPGQIFSKEQIYEKIWGYDAEGDSSTVTEHVKKIRAKFSEIDSGTQYISTAWGIGYRWEKIK
ncbi:transcriptional regulatory protein SpaR [Clostridium pasteurianum DSM 525 = ATCC 6013]|uniref:Stage 0 sporulation protein A homolog n=1 Tax=Clostridium pasteurianum DSM 525 = ATCC 6013 TaxID=1262449 RepID=A0A0H3J6E7_CLOPA|nr:response regulator transcription factor [Clostridium pasteurianum]AJA46525.1 transcriptional regulatory protein SpaR [Clostridium pasteurianum DSM 525 = ATCC 6013]AJA50513.1 transcriptional regulatory protein SpaR [Clostridium pasteurianum DSM 525 = ATCC 6013]AOZ73950.1 two-component system response regulator [Clostridium pasteurianum DSM 525 = ATCC 6013]AOZ77747.1 two-component system response regulator [Clostridium pasteurianum]ELP61098.1 transcriptional regulator [Clostridium pasteurianu